PPPAPAAAAPEPPAGPRVVAIELGRVTGKDHEGREVASTFGPREILYVTVAAENVTTATPVTTRWFEGEKLLHEESQDLPPDGRAVTEFHVTKASGWNPGAYRIEVLVDGKLVDTLKFEVTAPR